VEREEKLSFIHLDSSIDDYHTVYLQAYETST